MYTSSGSIFTQFYDYMVEVVVVVARLDHLGYQLKEDVMEGVRSEGVHCMYLTSSPVHRKVMTVLCNFVESSQVL